MKNRASSHLFVIVLIVALEIAGYVGIHRAGLLRGYETSIVGAVRDLLMFLPLLALVIWLSRSMRFAGNWILFTIAILLFSIGMLVQYRLYSDPEYNARNKAAAREEKMDALRTRYIMENYDPAKKQLMGLPPTPAQPLDLNQLPRRESTYSLWNALTSSYTWIPILSFITCALAYSFCIKDGFLLWLQRNSFIIVLFTLLPLAAAVVTSSAGKTLGNMTPWEPAKIPFLVGFAGILTARYKDLAETYWGIPRARDVVPLLVMAMLPFVPFFALKDLAEQSPAMQKSVNVDVWFDKLAFQPAQAVFGIASGKTTGRGLGLGYPEVIPIADSDYVYAAIAEEMGLAGGAIVILAVIVFVSVGVRISLDARDMFTKLCAAGLTAFIGFQALVNIGGILRALPMTGITLPFVSHGGFSLITSFAMLGMLMAFSHRNARDRVLVSEAPERYAPSIALEAVE